MPRRGLGCLPCAPLTKWGILLGALVFPVGFAIGDLLMPMLLNAIYGRARGEVYIPRAVELALYGVAIWGGLMFLIGWLRTIQCAVKRFATLTAMAVLPVMAIGYLWVLMVLFAK